MTRARPLLALVALWLVGVGARPEAAPGSLLRVSVEPALAASTAAGLVVSVAGGHDPDHRRTAPIDADLDAVFADLAPASYDVSLIGGGAVLASLTVRIGPSEGVAVEVQADPTPTGLRLAIVDRHQVALATAFDDRLVADLPASRDVWALIETSAPFVIVDRLDNGGAAIASSPLMGSRGSSWSATTVTLDDVVVRDAGRTGRLDVAPDAAFVSAVSVSAGLAPAEIGTPGVRVTLTPRRPGPVRRSEVFGSMTTGGLVGGNALPHAPSGTELERWHDVGGVSGGPVHARAGALVAASVSSAGFLERGEAVSLSADRASVFGHVVARPPGRDQLRVVSGFQRVAHPFDERRQFADRASATERARFFQGQATWERPLESGAVWTVSGGVASAHRTPSIGDAAGGVVDRLIDGVVPLPPAATDRVSWNAGSRWDGRVRRWGRVSHGLRAGVDLRTTGLTSEIVAQPVVAERVAGLPARVWVPQAPAAASRRRATHTALWIADSVAWSPRLSLDVGVRLDRAAASADGAAGSLAWTTLSPRVSFRWAPNAFAIFGGAGRYAAGHVLALAAHGDPGEAWFAVHRWRDHDADGRFAAGERGELVARGGWGAPVASIAAGVRAPVTREVIIGAEFEHGHSTFHGAMLVRRQSNLVASVNTGVPADAWDVRLMMDANADWDGPEDDQLLAVYDRRPEWFGRDAFLLTNVDDRVTYGGIELGWRFLSERWSMLFGAHAYRTRAYGADRGFGPLENDQHALGEGHHVPNARPVEPGSLFFDRSYVGKWAGSFHATDTWRLAFAARYQDGQPFTRVVVAPDLRTGPEYVHAYRLGRTRYTYTFTLDARVEKTLVVAGRELAVRLDVFNITNHRNELDEDVTTGPNYRQSLSVQPPLTVRLGVRVVF